MEHVKMAISKTAVATSYFNLYILKSGVTDWSLISAAELHPRNLS